jgi:hypothetical protein
MLAMRDKAYLLNIKVYKPARHSQTFRFSLRMPRSFCEAEKTNISDCDVAPPPRKQGYR